MLICVAGLRLFLFQTAKAGAGPRSSSRQFAGIQRYPRLSWEKHLSRPAVPQRPAPRLGLVSEPSVFRLTSSQHSRQLLKPRRKVFPLKPRVGGAKSSGSL